MILIPLAVISSVIIVGVINTMIGIKEDNITQTMIDHASYEAHQLEISLSGQEVYIDTVASALGIMYDYDDPDSFLNKISPLILRTAQSLENSQGAYFLFAPGIIASPRQVWYNREGDPEYFALKPRYIPELLLDSRDPSMDFYYKPLQTGQPSWIHPYRDKVTSLYIFSYTTPVFSRGKLIGITGFDITMDAYREKIASIHFQKTGYAFLLDTSNTIIYHPQFPSFTVLPESEMGDFRFILTDLDRGLQSDFVSYGKGEEAKKVAYYRLRNGWVLGIAAYTEEILKPVSDLKRNLILLSIFFFLFTSFLSYFAARHIAGPVRRLTEEVKNTAGNLELLLDDVRLLNRKDDLGKLAREFRNLQRAFQETLRRIIDTNVDMERMAQLGNQAGVFTHEIKSPVGVVLTSLTFARERLRELEEKVRGNTLKQSDFFHYVSTLNESIALGIRNTERAGNLVKDFRDTTVARSRMTEEDVDPRLLLEDLKTGLLMQYRDKEIEFINETGSCGNFHCNSGYLTQIMTNLINNSLLHGFHGRERGTIKIECTREGETVVFDYSDDGSGIPENYEERIFEPYFTSAGERGGTGLGLYIIRFILENYLDGTIDYLKKTGPGVLFRIVIPPGSERPVES